MNYLILRGILAKGKKERKKECSVEIQIELLNPPHSKVKKGRRGGFDD